MTLSYQTRTALATLAQQFADGMDEFIRTPEDAKHYVNVWIDNPNPSPHLGHKPGTDEEITFFAACVWAICEAGWRGVPLRPGDVITRAHASINQPS